MKFANYFRHVPFVPQNIDWYEYFWYVSVYILGYSVYIEFYGEYNCQIINGSLV